VSLVIATYNIHRCYGRGGLYDPHMTRQVLRDLDAQVIALQEVELPHNAPDLLEFFCEGRPWQAIPGLTMQRDTGHYGNALLTSLPVRSVQHIDLSLPRREPRAALYVTLEHRADPMAVIATHLGLRAAERRAQVERLLDVLQREPAPPVTVLMGDLNEWFLWGRPLRRLRRHFDKSPAPAAFPACCPALALDRIWVKPRDRLATVKSVRNTLTRAASDHLPITGTLR